MSNSVTTATSSGGRPAPRITLACSAGIAPMVTVVDWPTSSPGTGVVTRRTHRSPPSTNGATWSGVRTSSSTRSLRGPVFSSEPNDRPARFGSRRVTRASKSLIFAATAASVAVSGPSRTSRAPPPNRRRTRRSARPAEQGWSCPSHTGPAARTMPPLERARAKAATSASSSCGLSTVPGGARSSSGSAADHAGTSQPTSPPTTPFPDRVMIPRLSTQISCLH